MRTVFLSKLGDMVKTHPRVILLLFLYFSPLYDLAMPNMADLIHEKPLEIQIIIVAVDYLVFFLVCLTGLKFLLNKSGKKLFLTVDDIKAELEMLLMYGVSILIAYGVLLAVNIAVLREGYVPDIVLDGARIAVFSVLMGALFWRPLSRVDSKKIGFKEGFKLFKPYFVWAVFIMLAGLLTLFEATADFARLITFVQIIVLTAIYRLKA